MNADSSSDSARGNGIVPAGTITGMVRGWWQKLLRRRNGSTSIRETLEELIEEREEAEVPINANERVLLENILSLEKVTVKDVMVARAEIIAVDASISITELTDLMSRVAHSRLPVYRETLDDIVGMVHIKDVLACLSRSDPVSLTSIARKMLFVSPSMRVLDLLLQMRMLHIHMALVVDEYGGIDGLVTIEDLVEEIVGEIQDEHDVELPTMIERPDGSIIASARTKIEEFEDRFGPILTQEERDDDIDTLGGLVFSLMGRVPSRGEVICHSSGLEFEVTDADPRRIKRLRLSNLPKAAKEPEAEQGPTAETP